MQKTMILPVCLGILLLGIVITPSVFAAGETAAGGCGEGTVLEGNACVLAPQESSGGCGEGTVLKGNECVLAESSGTSIPSLYIAGGAAAIGAAIIGIVFAVRRGSGGTSTPKPAKKKETSSSCSNCGTPLNPKAKFCGKCGTPRS